MATEYKLSYTGAEINEKLGKIDVLLNEIANLGTVYIGKEKPTDGTLYWLDTSDTETETETVTYNVTKNLTNATIDNAAETVAEKSSYAATLTADEGCALSSVTVTMSDVDITSTSYDAGNVYIASVTGDIVITAVAVETAETVLYTVTNNLVNLSTSNSAVSVEKGTSYTATLTVAEGYAFDTVTVTMGGADVTADVYADGVINITAVTGDVVVTAVGVVKDMTFDDSNVYKNTTVDTGAAELAFSPTTTPTYNEFMSLDVEKLYFCFYPYDAYKKTMRIRGRYTAGWGMEVLAQNITIAQATNGTYTFITNAWDKYSESGYVVFEIDVAALKVGIQEMYDSGKLDDTKEKHLMIGSQLNVADGSTAYLLYKYNG